MRSAAFTVILLVGIFLLPAPLSFAQDEIIIQCPPTATVSAEEEEALRAATGKYLVALRAKDWDTTSKLSISFFKGFNLTQILMQDLLYPLEIESLSFELQEARMKPCEASVPYTLSLKAFDPQTRKPAIAVTGLERITRWRRFGCKCPPQNVTQWLLDSDVAEVGDLAKALASTKTQQEQRLLLLGKNENELSELAGVVARQGYEFLKKDQGAEALKVFGLHRAVIDQLKHHGSAQTLHLVRMMELMIAEAKKSGGGRPQSSALNSLGEVYRQRGEQEKALKVFGESLSSPDSGDGENAASAYRNIAAIHRDRGEYAHAMSYLLKSIERYKRLAVVGGQDGDSARNALFESLINLAFLYEATGREDLAETSYREISTMVRKGSDEEAIFLLLLGLVKAVKGNVAEAVERLEKSSSIFTRSVAEDKALYSFMSSYLLVEPYLRRNDYPGAAKHIERARDALRGVEEGESRRLLILLVESMLYGSQGDEQLAASRAKQFFRNITGQILEKPVGDETGSVASGGSREEGSDINAVTNVMALNALGTLLGVSLEDTGGGNETFNLPVVLNAAALEHLVRGGKENMAAARKWFSRVLEVAEADGDELLIAQTHERIAGVYLREKDYHQALDHFNKSLKIIEGAHLPLTLRLTELEVTTVSVWRNIARIHAALGNYEQALASYRKILGRSVRFYRLLDTNLLYEVAEIHFKMGEYDDALNVIKQALSVAAGGGDRDVLWKLHTLAGKSYRALKRDADSARSFAEAIREVEVSRSRVVGGGMMTERFFEDKLGPYHGMIVMLVEQGRCGEALAYAERSKSRVLLDALNRGGTDASQVLTAAEHEQERVRRGRMIAAEREVEAAHAKQLDSTQTMQLRAKRAEARLEYESFRINLRLAHAELNTSANASARTIEPAEIASLLPPAGGALLEFAVTDDKIYLFVQTEGVGNDGGQSATPLASRCEVHTINLGAKDMKSRVAELNKRIANSEGIVQSLSRELYDLLLKPAQATLAGRTTLVIVPDRDLWTLPFQALKPNNSRYLLQDSAIYYAPSLTSLREMRKTQARRMTRPKHASRTVNEMTTRSSSETLTLLVMADPMLSGNALPYLAKTRAQAPELKKLYGPGSKVYVREQANEARFKREAQGFDVIHIGAHGILDDDDPMYSRVLLSRTEKPTERAASLPPPAATDTAEDGLLEAWEIIDLELTAQLVVLSACETARGRVGDGEGLVGITWALFMAGAPSTIVSQWKVDEGATTELMYRFHQNFMRGAKGDPAHPLKAEALRQASLELIDSEKYGHPYYWAGFVLVGDGN